MYFRTVEKPWEQAGSREQLCAFPFTRAASTVSYQLLEGPGMSWLLAAAVVAYTHDLDG